MKSLKSKLRRYLKNKQTRYAKIKKTLEQRKELKM